MNAPAGLLFAHFTRGLITAACYKTEAALHKTKAALYKQKQPLIKL